MKTLGYHSVHSVGLPIVYQPAMGVERLTGSLLVMPTHSVDYNTHDWDFQRYADEIDAMRGRFSAIVACIGATDIRRGFWVKAFKERGIPVISGADFLDANSYSRLATLFGRFDFMTTNGMGSHVAYAALFGAKPSIYGSIAPRRSQDYEQDVRFQNNPDLLASYLALINEDGIRRRFGSLCVLPWEATERTEWANFQLGRQCTKSPEALMRLLGWSHALPPAARPAAWLGALARTSRHAVRRVVDREAHDRARLLSMLRQSPSGQPVRTTVHWPGLESTNGPRLAWELEECYYGDAYGVAVNPPEGPAIDLAPAEGVSVLALARHHPFRTVHYLQAGGAEGRRLRDNVRTRSEAADRLVPLLTSPELPAPGDLYSTKNWQAFREGCGSLLSEASVLRMAIEAASWENAVGALEDAPRCRLLLLVCNAGVMVIPNVILGRCWWAWPSGISSHTSAT